MKNYYCEGLAGERLKKVYDLAPPPIQKYLKAELDFILQRVPPCARVLELGCGYGRALKSVARHAALTCGIDTSWISLKMARSFLEEEKGCALFRMNAVSLGFKSGFFDGVFCIQNGISAFHVPRDRLIDEAVRVTKPGGRVFFSSYSENFWKERLDWFRIQAEAGLIGEIDERATGKGVIVCKDGFKAFTLGADDFSRLTASLGLDCTVTDVEGSSLFCEIEVPPPGKRTGGL